MHHIFVISDGTGKTEYFKRIESIEFTLRHDDGQHVDELANAEIVLVGVSRTFKTPLSIYLAFKGWLVANIPIILNFSPPSALFDVHAQKVFGLTTNAQRLAELRRVRSEHLGGAVGEYANLKFIRRELDYSNQIFNNHRDWSIIEVTNKPIEELASAIGGIIRLKKVF